MILNYYLFVVGCSPFPRTHRPRAKRCSPKIISIPLSCLVFCQSYYPSTKEKISPKKKFRLQSTSRGLRFHDSWVFFPLCHHLWYMPHPRGHCHAVVFRTPNWAAVPVDVWKGGPCHHAPTSSPSRFHSIAAGPEKVVCLSPNDSTTTWGQNGARHIPPAMGQSELTSPEHSLSFLSPSTFSHFSGPPLLLHLHTPSLGHT